MRMYSHRQTSVTTSRSGTSRLMARTARLHRRFRIVGACEPDVVLARRAGRTAARRARRRPCAAAASFTASSTERLKTPGIDADLAPDAFALADEQRADEAVGRQPRLAHQRAHRFGAAQPARPARQRQPCGGGRLPWARVLAPEVRDRARRPAVACHAVSTEMRGDRVDQRRDGVGRRLIVTWMPSCAAASAVTGPIAATTVFCSRSAACSAP